MCALLYTGHVKSQCVHCEWVLIYLVGGCSQVFHCIHVLGLDLRILSGQKKTPDLPTVPKKPAATNEPLKVTYAPVLVYLLYSIATVYN